METSSRWYVVMWQGGGKFLTLKCARTIGFTKRLVDAHVFDSREEAWKACRSAGWRRAVPEREEVVMRYLTQQEFTG